MIAIILFVCIIIIGVGAFFYIRRRNNAKKEEEAKAAASAAAEAATPVVDDTPIVWDSSDSDSDSDSDSESEDKSPVSAAATGDFVKPDYKLRNAQTNANDWGGGNMIFLDRHTVDCGDDGLNEFKLGRPSPAQIQYKYKCLDGINSPANINKDTGANDWGGGNTIFLDRHNVDCAKNPIAKFRLVRPQPNTIRYDYTCNSKKVSGPCRDADTGWNQESNQQIYLDRHDVKCNDNEVITKFKLNRDGKGKFRYDYTCCEM